MYEVSPNPCRCAEVNFDLRRQSSVSASVTVTSRRKREIPGWSVVASLPLIRSTLFRAFVACIAPLRHERFRENRRGRRWYVVDYVSGFFEPRVIGRTNDGFRASVAVSCVSLIFRCR